MKLQELFTVIQAWEKFVNKNDSNPYGYYFLEDSGTVRYVAYEGCPASTIPLCKEQLFSDGWELKE